MDDSYKAYFVKAPFQFELREVPVGEVAFDEVLVRIEACGVCGWDILFCRTVADQWKGVGHECSGEVATVGAGVKSVKPGDRVVVENATFCGHCERCKNGEIEHCVSFHGYLSPGAFAEYVKVKAAAVWKMPDGMPFEVGALAEPLTVALDMVGMAEIPLGGSVAIYGPGPIGLMCAVLASRLGAGKVYLLGRSHSRARFRAAAAMGITRHIHVDTTDAVALLKEGEPRGIDRVLITAPPAVTAQAVEIARFGSIIVYDGISFDGSKIVSFDGNAFHFKRLQLRGVHSIPNLGFPKALALLESGCVEAKRFITHRFPFGKVPEAITFAAENRTDAIKVMVTEAPAKGQGA